MTKDPVHRPKLVNRANSSSNTIGKRTAKGVHGEIIPSAFQPPVRLSPGLVSHIVKMGLEKKPVFRYFG